MSLAHQGSRILAKRVIIPVDQYTTALFHYDITKNEVLKGIAPINDITTLREGYFGGGIGIDEGTTNLWIGGFSPYNNYATNGQMTHNLYALGEYYQDQPIYRLEMTPVSANAVTSVQNDYWSHGVVGSTLTYNSGNSYMSSIYWRAINKSDVTVGGTASNIAGWTGMGTIQTNDGWNRSFAKWYDTTTRTDSKYWSFRCPSSVANETIITDWVLPQIEQKIFATSYVKGTRLDGALRYKTDLLFNPNGFTVSMWFNIPRVYSDSVGNTGIQGNWYHPVFEVCPTSNRGDAGLSIVVTPQANYSPTRKIHLRSPRGSYGTTTINDNTWYNMCVTFDGTTYKIYIDGKLETSNSLSAPTMFTDSVIMVGGGYFGKSNILIDELRIDSIARTEEEVLQWYIAQNPFYPKGVYRIAY